MELWDLYTEDRMKTGRQMIRGEEKPVGLYRVLVHVCIFNKEGKMLIQQRQPFKEGWSGMWDITVGGSVVAGESSREAAEREIYEEIGCRIDLSETRPTLTVNDSNGFDDIYLIQKEIDIKSLRLQYEEVKEVKWAAETEILQMIEAGIFIPYYKEMVGLFFSMRNRNGTHRKKSEV